jgi:hypothetical protein
MDTQRLQDRAAKTAEDVMGILRTRSSDLMKKSGELANRSPIVVQRRGSMWPLRLAWLAGGMAVGTALAYFFDPQRGNVRRRMAYGRLRAKGRDLGRWSGKKARHLRNRGIGAVAEARGSMEEVQGSSRY